MVDAERVAVQTEVAKVLLELQPEDGIGVAVSFLLLMSQRQPTMVRRVLNERVIQEGFRGVSMLETLIRVCR